MARKPDDSPVEHRGEDTTEDRAAKWLADHPEFDSWADVADADGPVGR